MDYSRGLSETHLHNLVGQALFVDGVANVIAGADPMQEANENALFELWWTGETILPNSDGTIDGHLKEVGLTFHLLMDVPGLICKNNEKSLTEDFDQFGITDWNELFWIVHPSGPVIL
eukprot:Gb_37536 [translate_table: standard]